uniref:Immunoglobulin V-set domain-containing protein n=1 Tax=Cyprinus carpio TaxID=7962 RepID=A0A8C1TF54_CYPCA
GKSAEVILYYMLLFSLFKTFEMCYISAGGGGALSTGTHCDSVKSFVTLSCSYSSARSLFWYRQYPGSAPEFLVTITYSATEAKKLSVILTKQEQKHVDLKISSAAVSDSALYYCALQPTVTGNTSALYKNSLPSESEQEYRSYSLKYCPSLCIHSTFYNHFYCLHSVLCWKCVWFTVNSAFCSQVWCLGTVLSQIKRKMLSQKKQKLSS